MIDYSQVIKAWRVYRRERNWIKKYYPTLLKHCKSFVNWAKEKVKNSS